MSRIVARDSSAEVPAVEVVEVGYTYPGRSRPTLDGISFTVPRGSFTLVTGATGSGKSTLLRALVGLIPNLAHGEMTGEVRLLGCSLAGLAPAATARLVGFVQQSPDDQICTTTVRAELAFGIENLNLPIGEIEHRVIDAAQQFGLQGELDRPTSHLSGGQKQRLILASIMAMRPPVLVCDEPLSRLDPNAARQFLAELRRLHASGTTVIVTEHRVEEILPLADRVLRFEAGKLCNAGSAAPEDSETGSDPGHRHSKQHAPRPSPLVHVERLGFRYPSSSRPLWTDVSFDVRAGERIALVGPNGSGKSTLLAALSGELRTNDGRLDWRLEDRRLRTVLVPQEVDLSLFCATVRDELAYAPRRQGLTPPQVDDRINSVAALFGLGELLDDPPFALSRGQRVRTALAAALTTAPQLLLLDEPSTGQDAPTLNAVMDALSTCLGAPGGPQALLFSTHDRRLAERHADRVFLLRNGRLREDATLDEWFNALDREDEP